ncbi:hypothetical protein AYO22_09258 [Fonsecaea multimorphosa]|nr:hypothetical protein AYO22_09258 [Fonsecaea multimorphosa]
MKSRVGNLHYVIQPDVEQPDFAAWSIVRMVKPWYEWLVIMMYKPTCPADFMPEKKQVEDQAKSVLGDVSIPVDILRIDKWFINETVAECYSKGQVFCLGDAVHRHPPMNGLGSNTCIQDAANLAWKVALVEKGLAGRSLLDSYSVERAPVGAGVVDRANSSLREHIPIFESLGFLNPSLQERKQQLAILDEVSERGRARRQQLIHSIDYTCHEFLAQGSDMGQRYESSAIFLDDAGTPPKPPLDPVLYYEPHTYPGVRLPHAWLNTSIPQKPVSTLDLSGKGRFALFIGHGGDMWRVAAARVKENLGLDVAVFAVGFGLEYEAVYNDWYHRREVNEDGCVLHLPSFLVEERQQEDNEDRCYAALLALLEQQGRKLDLLTGQMAMLTGAQNLPSPPSSREHGFETAYKRGLPLLHSQTSSLFCINVIDPGVQKFHGSNKPMTQPASPSTSTPSPFWIIQGEIVDGDWSDMSQSDASGSPSSASHMPLPQVLSPSSLLHPLEELDDNQIMQTIESYGVLEGLMYPIVDTAHIMRIAECFTGARAPYSNQRPPGFPTLELRRSDLVILKLVLATGLLTEGDTHSTMALRLFQSVHSEVESMLWSDTVDLKDLVSMTLVCIFYLRRGIWRRGWRFLGNVTRIILELGLNREIVLIRSFPDASTRSWVVNTIWTIYVLERQLSYGLGVANAAQELRLEPTFPRPLGAVFLIAMAEYSRIGKQATDDLFCDGRDTGPQLLHNWRERYAFFQYQLEQWTQHTSSDLEHTSANERATAALHLVRTTLSLRANHLRTLISRSFLCTTLRDAAPPDIWTTSVDVAANTVEILVGLDNSTKEFRFHQALFNHFLITALDVLLFATTFGSSKRGNPSANGKEIIITEEAHLKARQSSLVAMNLLRALAGTTYHSKYLWERMRGVAAHLNLSSYLFSTAPGAPGVSGGNAVPDLQGQAAASGPADQANTEHCPLRAEQANDLSGGQYDTDIGKPKLSRPIEDYSVWDWGGDLLLSEFEFLPDTSSLRLFP